MSCSLPVVPLALLLMLIDKFVPFAPSHYILVDLVLLAFVAGFWASFLKRRPLRQSAARIDRIAGLHEVLTTAVELETTSTRNPFAPIVIQDALHAIEKMDPWSLSPLVNLRRVKVLIVSLIGLLALSLIPGSIDESGASVRHAAIASSTSLPSLIKGAAKLREFDDPAMQVLGRKLENVFDESSRPGATPWEVSNSLRTVSRALSVQSKMRVDMIEAINTLSKIDYLQHFADAVRSGMRDEIDNAVDNLTEKIAGGEIRPQKREEIAEQLRELSGRISFNALSYAVKETASAIENGNAGNARAALEYLGTLIEDDSTVQDTLATISNVLNATKEMEEQLASSVPFTPCPICRLHHPDDHACPENSFDPSGVASQSAGPSLDSQLSGSVNLPKYRRAAMHAIQSKQIPPEYEDAVKAYFDNLDNSGD